MSATRLLVLGVVRMHGEAHGYQVRRELLGWSADKWANVAPGSIYHALKKMSQEGLLAESATSGESRGSGRTTYRLTGDGETEFHSLLGRTLASGDNSAQSQYELTAAITFLTALPREKAISLLRHRLRRLTGEADSVRDVLEHGTSWGHPAHVNELYRLWGAGLDACVGWLEKLLGRLEAGEYLMADDQGRAFGEPPTKPAR